MPGVHLFFSKSVPAGYVAGSTPGCAPIADDERVLALPADRGREVEETGARSSRAYSPSFVPFSQTAVPNCALLTRRVATALRAGSVNVRRYQK